MDAAILRTLARIRRGEGVEEGRNVFEGKSLYSPDIRPLIKADVKF